MVVQAAFTLATVSHFALQMNLHLVARGVAEHVIPRAATLGVKTLSSEVVLQLMRQAWSDPTVGASGCSGPPYAWVAWALSVLASAREDLTWPRKLAELPCVHLLASGTWAPGACIGKHCVSRTTLSAHSLTLCCSCACGELTCVQPARSALRSR